MLITSSRKPSANTKILCKKLAVFFDCHYMTRGKMSFSEVLEEGRENIILLVGEFHGNPGSLAFYDTNGNICLSLHISQTAPVPLAMDAIKKGMIGLALSKKSENPEKCEAAEKLYQLIADSVFEGFLPEIDKCGRVLTVSSETLDFSVKGNVFLKLYIKGMKIYNNSESEKSEA